MADRPVLTLPRELQNALMRLIASDAPRLKKNKRVSQVYALTVSFDDLERIEIRVTSKPLADPKLTTLVTCFAGGCVPNPILGPQLCARITRAYTDCDRINRAQTLNPSRARGISDNDSGNNGSGAI